MRAGKFDLNYPLRLRCVCLFQTNTEQTHLTHCKLFIWCFFVFPLASIAEHVAVNTTLRAEVLMLTTSMQELKSLNSCLRDEHCALQLAFASLEEKLRKVQVIFFLCWNVLTMIDIQFWLIFFQDENRQLVDRLIKYKAKDAEKLNEENESFLKYV